MKNLIKSKFSYLKYVIIILFAFGIQNLNAQNADKNKVRLKANYVKIMNGPSYIDIEAGAKVDDQNIKVPNIDLTIYNELEEENVKLGNIKTNENGKARFILKDLKNILPDSSNTYTISIAFKGNDTYSRASKSISFKDVNINAQLEKNEGTNYLLATLIDPSTSLPLVDEPLTVQVKRIFKPLKIGGDFNNTDENGTIRVEVEKGIPAMNGNLTLEVVLNDSDDYGTVKALVNAPLGIPIVNESTYNQRTMWSPPNKTPMFLLIIANLLIIGVWITIILLINNLIKINKSNN
jgi:hypothetical protein